jgi:hypothetical protein
MTRRLAAQGRARIPAFLLLALTGVTSSAAAQPAASRAHSFELAAGVIWAGGSSLGRDDANETTNAAGGPPFRLFSASTKLDSGVGAEARLAFYLTPRFAIEGSGLVSRHQISTDVTGDFESIPDVTAVEDFTEFIIDGAAAVHFRPMGGVVPFVRGGVGYLRQLHDGNSLVETGVAYHAGGGVSHWFSDPHKGFITRWGIRADARVVIRSGGFRLDDKARAGAVLGGALLVAF